MTLYAFDKRFKDYEEYGKTAIYDFKRSQLDRFGFSLDIGETLFVVKYIDRSRPVTARKINVSKYEISKIRAPSNRGCGVIHGKLADAPKTFNRDQFAKQFGFMLDKNGSFIRRSFHKA